MRGIATRGTILAPSPSTETPAADSVAVVAVATVAASVVAQIARFLAENPNRLVSILELSWLSTELRAFAVGWHASVKDEFMLLRGKIHGGPQNGTQK